MEQKTRLHNLKRCIKVLHVAVLLSCFSCIFTSCDKEDRTTVIYGKVTDQNLQPVDSIYVIISGMWDFHIEAIRGVYTDKNGNYEVVIDIPKKYIRLDTTIPYLSLENPKFQGKYDVDIVWKNGEQTGNCCTASIGKKTEYNFQLKSRK